MSCSLPNINSIFRKVNDEKGSDMFNRLDLYGRFCRGRETLDRVRLGWPEE